MSVFFSRGFYIGVDVDHSICPPGAHC